MGEPDTASVKSDASKASSKIRENRQATKNYNPHKVKLLQDRLDEKGKARLAELLKEIDDDLPRIMKDKEQYYKNAGKSAFDTESQRSRVTAYSHAGEDSSKMTEIDEKLTRLNPSLVGSQMGGGFDQEASVLHAGRHDPNRDRQSHMADDRSQVSGVTSGTAMSRRSAVSLIDINSLTSDAPTTLGGQKRLPGEGSLRANA